MRALLFVLLMGLLASTQAAQPPATLFQLAGVASPTASLSEAVVVVIDAQEEYRTGALALPGIEPAVAAGAQLLARARAAKTPIVHVVHRGISGGLFDPAGPYYAILAPLKPQAGEPVVEKQLPDAFAGTQLAEILRASGRKQLIVIGFMTHMCVSATVHSALNFGYSTTVVASATATRPLPDGSGGEVTAATLQSATLAGLADRFATVVTQVAQIPD